MTSEVEELGPLKSDLTLRIFGSPPCTTMIPLRHATLRRSTKWLASLSSAHRSPSLLPWFNHTRYAVAIAPWRPRPTLQPRSASYLHTSAGETSDEPTIYALSTAPGRAAIAVIRVSGLASVDVRHNPTLHATFSNARGRHRSTTPSAPANPSPSLVTPPSAPFTTLPHPLRLPSPPSSTVRSSYFSAVLSLSPAKTCLNCTSTAGPPLSAPYSPLSPNAFPPLASITTPRSATPSPASSPDAPISTRGSRYPRSKRWATR